MQSGVLSLKAQRSKEHAFRYFQFEPASKGFCFHVCVHWHTYVHLCIRLFLLLYKVLIYSRTRTSGGCPVQRLLTVTPGVCGNASRIWRIKQVCFKSVASVRRFSRWRVAGE